MTEAERKRAEARHKRRDLGPKSTIKPGHILRSSDPPERLERILEGTDNPWRMLPAGYFTPRQRLALEHPVELPSTGWVTGTHTGDPRFRAIEIHSDPYRRDEAHVRTLGDEYIEQRRYQLVTILTVDLDSPPVWHLSLCWVYNPDDWAIEPRQYWQVNGKAQYDWMGALIPQKIAELIPGAGRGRHLYVDIAERSVHVRSVLERGEQAIVAVLGAQLLA